MPDQPSTLREQRRAETQRTIQAHAVRLFTEHGYDATTVTDVAEAAGVSPMTVYRHFPTKEDLVLGSSPSGSSRRPPHSPWSVASAARSSTRPRR
jgi:transcriptional regulator GlxA family with amidase domain